MSSVTGTVRFNVRVRAKQRDDRWMVLCVETGVLTFGTTRDEAENLNGAANVHLVRLYKEMGEAALDEFMTSRGIEYRIDDSDGAEQSHRIALAA